MKLTKSLAELDAAADELLAKSKTTEKIKKSDEEDNDGVTPEEVSENATVTPDTEDAENADAEKDEKNEEPEDEEQDEEPVKKSEDVEPVDEETEEDEDKDEDEGEDKSPDELEKSLREDFESDETVRKGMENSEFYAAVVDIFAKSLGDMQYDVQHQGKAQAAAADVLAKSLQAVIQTNKTLQSDNDRLTRRISKLEKSVSQGFDRIMDSLDEISSQPVGMRKSLSSISVHDRDFDQSLNGQKTVGGFDSLSKSQVLDILNTELYSGNQNVTPQDIISYESGAPLRPNLQSLVASKCK